MARTIPPDTAGRKGTAMTASEDRQIERLFGRLTQKIGWGGLAAIIAGTLG